MLILEGPDLVGKTTMAQKIVAKPGMQSDGYIYRHLSRLPDGWRVRNYMQLAYRKSVQDRFHMSEPAYAFARGEDSSRYLNRETYRLVDGWLRGLGAFTVLVTASEELIESRYDVRREMYPLDKILKANLAFKGLANGMSPWGEYWGRPDIDVHINLCADEPFVSDEKLDAIVKAYHARQCCIRVGEHCNGNSYDTNAYKEFL